MEQWLDVLVRGIVKWWQHDGKHRVFLYFCIFVAIDWGAYRFRTIWKWLNDWMDKGDR